MTEYWDNINSKCGLLTCTKPGGVFKSEAQYPYFVRSGYTFLVLLPIDNPHETVFVGLTDFGDYYKTYTLSDKEEDAIFREVNRYAKL